MTRRSYLPGVSCMLHIKICISFALLFLLVGCAPGKVTLSAYERQVEVILPTVGIDRYEAVVFPAGRLE